MQENGIYNKWEGSYLYRWYQRDSEDEVVNFKTAQLLHFESLFAICTGLIVSALIAYLQELLSKKENAKKAIL